MYDLSLLPNDDASEYCFIETRSGEKLLSKQAF
jgi:hypothetical protein